MRTGEENTGPLDATVKQIDICDATAKGRKVKRPHLSERLEHWRVKKSSMI